MTATEFTELYREAYREGLAAAAAKGAAPGGDDLRKRAPEPADGEALRLIKLAHERLGKVEGTGERLTNQRQRAATGSRPLAKGAILDAHARADHLRKLAAATPGYVSGAVVAEAAQKAAFVEALRDVGRTNMAELSGLNDKREEMNLRLREAMASGNPEAIDAARRAIEAEELRVATRLAPRMQLIPGGGDRRASA